MGKVPRNRDERLENYLEIYKRANNIEGKLHAWHMALLDLIQDAGPAAPMIMRLVTFLKDLEEGNDLGFDLPLRTRSGSNMQKGNLADVVLLIDILIEAGLSRNEATNKGLAYCKKHKIKAPKPHDTKVKSVKSPIESFINFRNQVRSYSKRIDEGKTIPYHWLAYAMSYNVTKRFTEIEKILQESNRDPDLILEAFEKANPPTKPIL